MFFVLSESSLAGIYLEVVSGDWDWLAHISSNNFVAIASLLSYSVKSPDSSEALAYDSSG